MQKWLACAAQARGRHSASLALTHCCFTGGGLRTMHLRHLRGSRQKARCGSIDASLCPVTPGNSHRDRFTLGGIQRKLAGGNPDRMPSDTLRPPEGQRPLQGHGGSSASLAEEFRHHALAKDPAPQAPRAPAAASSPKHHPGGSR